MKNVKENQLKKCIFLTQTELENILSEKLQKTVTVNVDLYGLSVCTEEDMEDMDNGRLCDELSEYFDVNVSSVHIDDCDIVGVWVCYKEFF
ncbi:MAG: hypothetical protein II305_04410 [Clostridia bacterium]|nr:hypothetical protein [Clostridia bacterium]